MSRRFVILVDHPTPEQTRKINDIFRDKYAWWHWIHGAWLVVDSGEILSTTQIRNDIKEAASGSNILVLQVTSGSWAGFGPSKTGKNMFDWIRNNWE